MSVGLPARHRQRGRCRRRRGVGPCRWLRRPNSWAASTSTSRTLGASRPAASTSGINNFNIDLMSLRDRRRRSADALAEGGGSVMSIGTTAVTRTLRLRVRQLQRVQGRGHQLEPGPGAGARREGQSAATWRHWDRSSSKGRLEHDQGEDGRLLRCDPPGPSWWRALGVRRRTSPTSSPSSPAIVPGTSTVST